MKIITFWILLCSCSLTFAQNLVPNPSFEDYSLCPQAHDGTNLLDHWSVPSGHTGTTDYFNACGPSTVGVPTNFIGVQDARTGDAYIGQYIGFATPAPADYREYIQVKLSAPLQANVLYSVGAWLSFPEYASYSVDRFGFYLSSTPLTGNNSFYVLPVVPQVESSGVFFTNSNGWEYVGGTFVATGGEEYLTIGNFRDTSMTNMQASGAFPAYGSGFIYVDDVIVQEGEITALASNGFQGAVQVFPTHLKSDQSIQIKIPAGFGKKAELSLYDSFGKVLVEKSQALTAGQDLITLGTSGAQSGLHFIKVTVGEREESFRLLFH